MDSTTGGDQWVIVEEPRTDTIEALAKPTPDSTLATAGDLQKIERENGIGHFCFGRISAKDRKKADFLLDSNNAPFVELNGFQRVGSFQFLKLPIELQHMIFEELIAPFLSPKNGIIRLFIEDVHDLEGYLKRKIKAYAAERAEEDNKALAEGIEFYLTWVKERQENRCHYQDIRAFLNDREKYEYKMTVDVNKYPGTGSYKPDLAMTDLVRNLFNVSTGFRKEFGSLFWAKTLIQIDAMALGYGCFLPFLKSRPAIRQCLKGLEIYVDFLDYGDDEWDNVESTFNFLSEKVTLQQFELKITVMEEHLAKLASGTGIFKRLSNIQHLSVTKSFNIILNVLLMDPEIFEGDAEPWEEDCQEMKYCIKVAREHVQAVLEFLTPNTLREDANGDNVKLAVQTCGGDYSMGGSGLKTLKQWEADSVTNDPEVVEG